MFCSAGFWRDFYGFDKKKFLSAKIQILTVLVSGFPDDNIFVRDSSFYLFLYNMLFTTPRVLFITNYLWFEFEVLIRKIKSGSIWHFPTIFGVFWRILFSFVIILNLCHGYSFKTTVCCFFVSHFFQVSFTQFINYTSANWIPKHIDSRSEPKRRQKKKINSN